MSLLAHFKGGRGPSGFGFASTAEEVTAGLDLSGQRVLVTGINSGIGLESGRVLALRGAHVIGATRTLEKARSACAGFEGEHTPIACELSEPSSVRDCVAQLQDQGLAIDAMICNAGVMALPKLEQSHGIELQLMTNHVGHVILVEGLLDLLSERGRVIMVSSNAHKYPPAGGIQFDNLSGENGYSGFRAYGQSKLANVLYARELARRFEGTDRVANAVHPGGIATRLGRHMGTVANVMMPVAAAIFLKSVAQGAATQCWAAVHPDTARVNGTYMADCNVAKGSALSEDEALAQRLWKTTEQLVADLSAAEAMRTGPGAIADRDA